MTAKAIVTVVLLGFVAVSVGYLIIGEARTARTPAPAAGTPDATNPPPAAHKVVAYYIHNTQRCQTCLKIEHLAEGALRDEFADALERGELEWRTRNMEETPNEHFVTDFDLVTSSLVIVDLHDGQQHAWTNMERVWELVHGDEVAFREYVADQVRTYLES